MPCQVSALSMVLAAGYGWAFAFLSKEQTAAQVNIYNEIGILMKANKTTNLSKGRNQINVDGTAFSPGMYMVEIITGDAKTVRKVVKL